MIVARTIKGKGVTAVEDKNGWHGKALDDPDAAIEELGGIRNIRVDVAKPRDRRAAHGSETGALELPRYELGDGGRDAQGVRRRARGARQRRAATSSRSTARSRNSTFAEIFAKAHPERYFEMYIAEQQMVAAAVGLQARGWNAVRLDLRRVPLARLRLHPHGGDQPREPRLCRLARGRLDRRGRAVADGARGHRVVPRRPRPHGAPPLRREPDREARRGDGRHSRGSSTSARCGPKTPVIYGADEEFRDRRLAGRCATGDDVAIVGAGITVHEALKAAETLAERGHRGARDRPLLGQADRRGDAAGGG